MEHAQTVGESPTIDFLIITALDFEEEAVKRIATSLGSEVVPQRYLEHFTYYYFEIDAPSSPTGFYRVALTRPVNKGNVPAAVRTSQAISALDPLYVFMVGIAAGVDDDLCLGDVIVSQAVWYSEPGKIVDGTKQLRPDVFNADHQLLDRAQHIDPTWCEAIDVARPDGNEEAPNVCYGIIGAGESVYQDATAVNLLKSRIANLAAIEMESGGVAYAAFAAAQLPGFIAVRGISDFADAQKHEHDTWRPRAAAAAAAFALNLIAQGGHPPRRVPHHVEKQQRSANLIAVNHLSLYEVARASVEDAVAAIWDKYQLSTVTIDQTDLCVNGRLTNIQEAVERQRTISDRVSTALHEHPGASLAYFGLAYIPLLFWAGYQMPKHSFTFFEFDRDHKTWRPLLDAEMSYPELELSGLPSEIVNDEGDAVLRIGVSYEIACSDTEAVIPSPLASLNLSLKKPQLDILKSRQQLVSYSHQFRAALDDMRRVLPNLTTLHIFYAGPASLAVSLGQMISHTYDPDIATYNYRQGDTPAYGWGLKLSPSAGEADFILGSQASAEAGNSNV